MNEWLFAFMYVVLRNASGFCIANVMCFSVLPPYARGAFGRLQLSNLKLEAVINSLSCQRQLLFRFVPGLLIILYTYQDDVSVWWAWINILVIESFVSHFSGETYCSGTLATRNIEPQCHFCYLHCMEGHQSLSEQSEFHDWDSHIRVIAVWARFVHKV